MKKFGFAASTLLLTAGVSTSALLGVGTASAASNSQLTIGISSDVNTLDPALSSSLYDRQLMVNIYDSLFQVTAKNTIAPDLVKSFKISKDGLTYTMNLRHGVKFQDGTPFNAAAVKFNLQRDEQSSSPRHSEVNEIAQIITKGQYTVILKLRFPFSPLLGILASRSGMMVSPTAVKKEGSDFANHPVGTGPYSFSDRVPGDHITLTKNPNYWGKKGSFQTVTFKVFNDPNVELANLQSGAVQVVDTLPPAQVSSIASNKSYVVINKPSLGYGGFDLNTKSSNLSNPYLREAIDRAVNRQTIINVMLKGVAQPAWGPFGVMSPAYNKATETPPTPVAATVKQLLKQGGKPNGFSFTMQTSSASTSVQEAQIIQGMLQQYGIQMQIQQLDFPTMLSNAMKGNYDASLIGWSGRYEPDQNIYSDFYTGGGQNFTGFNNPQVDKLLDLARKQTSMADRTKTYAQIMTILHQQVPYVYIDTPDNVIAYDSTLKGFDYRPDGLIRAASLQQK